MTLRQLQQRVAAFGERYSSLGKPFAWTFTRQELEPRLRDPVARRRRHALILRRLTRPRYLGDGALSQCHQLQRLCG